MLIFGDPHTRFAVSSKIPFYLATEKQNWSQSYYNVATKFDIVGELQDPALCIILVIIATSGALWRVT